MAQRMEQFRDLLHAARRASPDETSIPSSAVTMLAVGAALAAECDELSVEDLVAAVREIFADPAHSVRQTTRAALAEVREHLATSLVDVPPGTKFTVVRLPQGGCRS